MKEQLIQAKKQVAVAIADEKKLKKQLDAERQKAQEWEKKAMMAVRAGRDDLAKEALNRKSEHDELAEEFQTQWEAQKAAADKLRDSLRALNSKIEEAKRKKNLLIARKKRAEAQKTIQETMSGSTTRLPSIPSIACRRRSSRWRPKPRRPPSSPRASAATNSPRNSRTSRPMPEPTRRSPRSRPRWASRPRRRKGDRVLLRRRRGRREEEVEETAKAKAGGRGTWDSEDF